MATLSLVSEDCLPIGFPSWVERDITITNGHDPLGLESIATYGIAPMILPGILALSRRARYFSFHTFLLDDFVKRRRGTTLEELDRFIRRCEFEFGYAVKICPRCGWAASGVLGDVNIRKARWTDGSVLERSLSVQTAMGGYGLFYASPLEFLGIVARSRSEQGTGAKVPHDCIANARGRELAAHFRAEVEHTAWYRYWIGGDDPVPKDVLAELSEVACLCRLPESPTEHAAILNLLFGLDQPDEDHLLEAQQRRNSMALMLEAIAAAPKTALNPSDWRETLWRFAEEIASAESSSGDRANTAAQWGALVAREYQQAGLSIIWHTVCRLGNTFQPFGGFLPTDFDKVLRSYLPQAETVMGLSAPSPDMATVDFSAILHGELKKSSLENLLVQALANPTGPSGLALLLLLCQRLPDLDRMPAGWRQVGDVDGGHQEGLLSFALQMARHLEGNPRVVDTLLWLARRFVITRHQHIAATKLPRFTYRFRMENGRLRFFGDRRYDAFGAGEPRWEPLTLIGRDLDLWALTDAGPALTYRGHAFVREVFAGQ